MRVPKRAILLTVKKLKYLKNTFKEGNHREQQTTENTVSG